MYVSLLLDISGNRPRRISRATAETAHTQVNVVTDAVFHAPMFALNADASRNACEPTTRGVRRWKRTHMRACARRLGAAAHKPRRQRKPTVRVKTFHTEDNVVTDAVFHAPMFALNADA